MVGFIAGSIFTYVVMRVWGERIRAWLDGLIAKF